MSDYRRAWIPGGVFFFTVVTHHRRAIFDNEWAVAQLRQAFRAVQQTRFFAIDAIVVLPDHLHCIWRLPDGDADYSGRWREIKKTTTRRIASNAVAGVTSQHVWQRRFWEHAIRDEADWRAHMDYIHYNPVKHGYVSQPRDWPWSSLAACVAKGLYEMDWGETPPVSIRDWELE